MQPGSSSQRGQPRSDPPIPPEDAQPQLSWKVLLDGRRLEEPERSRAIEQLHSEFRVIIRSQKQWADLLRLTLEDLSAGIDYECQATDFNHLFDFLVEYATSDGQAPLERASLFRRLDIARLSLSQIERLRGKLRDVSWNEFASSAFETTSLMQQLVTMRSEIREIGITVEEWRAGRNPQWIRFKDSSHFEGILRAIAISKKDYMTFESSRGFHVHETILSDLQQGRQINLVMNGSDYLAIFFKGVRIRFTHMVIRFCGTAPIVFDDSICIEWRLDVIRHQPREDREDGSTSPNIGWCAPPEQDVRPFEFVETLGQNDCVSVREMDPDFDCDSIRLTAMSDYVRFSAVEFFGLLSVPP
jgi:hypothetical protein